MTPEVWVEVFKTIAWSLTLIVIAFIISQQIPAAAKRFRSSRFRGLEKQSTQPFTVAGQPGSPLAAEPATAEPATPTAMESERQSKVVEAALDAAESAGFDQFDRHVVFESGLTFDGVALRDEIETIYLFEVILLGTQEAIPPERVEAASKRARALRRVYENLEVRVGTRLTFLIVTELEGDAFLKLVRSMRRRFCFRRGQDVRIFPTTALSLK